MVVQAAPAFSGSQIDDDDAIRSRRRGVGNESYPLRTTVQVKSDVIQIGHWQSYVRGENDFFGDPVRVEVNRDQLRTTRFDPAEREAPGVENPETTTGRINNDALHRDQYVRLVVAACVMIDFRVRVRKCLSIFDFRDGVFDVVSPFGEVYKNPAIVGDSNPRRHWAVKGCHHLQLTDDGFFRKIPTTTHNGERQEEKQNGDRSHNFLFRGGTSWELGNLLPYRRSQGSAHRLQESKN